MTGHRSSPETEVSTNRAGTELPTVTGLRAVTVATERGLPSVASGIIARRKIVMPLLE